jgi:hypothetical protein
LALAVPLSRFTPRVGGGSAFYVRLHDASHNMTTNPQIQRTCPECKSTDIAAGIGFSMSTNNGRVGLSCKPLGVFPETASLFADVCRQCGTVVRFFVRDVDKAWVDNTK